MIMAMSDTKLSQHPVLLHRLAHGWSQADLAKRTGISRAAVSAIEGQRLSPSVATALALAKEFECSVEELFSVECARHAQRNQWAWAPRTEPSRYWETEVGRRRMLYPVEAHWLNPIPHDGVWENGVCRERESVNPEKTLTVATCDPGAGLLATEYASLTGFRLLIFPRPGLAALQLLRQGLIHVAALHRSTPKAQERNAETVRERLGNDYQLLRVAEWEEGLAVPQGTAKRSVSSVAKHTTSWAAREPGSGARECLDELLAGRSFVGREVTGHGSVAEAVRSGWAGAGVCVRFSAEEAGLSFLPIRKESLDFCFPNHLQHDPRVRALVRLLRTRGYRRLVSELPGYEALHTGELSGV
jgi:molybdate-binding protein/DNA-binding XRE family transcriptional regulator